MSKVTIDHQKCDCADCGECVDVCMMEILILNGDKIDVQRQEECNLCETCIDVCPNYAIKIG